MDTAVAPRGPLGRAGTVLVAAGLAITTLPLLASPAFAVVGNSQGSPPQVECGGLEYYLDKFGFEEGEGGSFEEDDAAANTDTAPSYAYASSTGVSVAFTEDADGEVRSVDWTSETPISLIWVKAGGDRDDGEYYTPARKAGTISVPLEDNALGHVTFCIRSQVEIIKAFTETDGSFPTAQPDPLPAFLVEVYDGIVAIGEPTASDFPAATDEDRFGFVESGQYTVVEEEIEGYGEVACADEVTTEFGATSSGTGTFTAPELGTTAVHVVCNAPETTRTPEAPQFTVTAGCDETDNPIVTVTVTSNPDDELIQVEITGEDPVTITETTVFEGDPLDHLTASYGETEEEATFPADCGSEELRESTASFTTTSRCRPGLPVLAYDATISETGDDPVGDVTLTVLDADGVERAETTFSETAAGSLPLPTALEGETVAVSWDFDDTTRQQTLASGCAAVLGAVDDNADLPATNVKGAQVGNEQLPNAGFEHVVLLVLGGGLLALGGLLLRLSDRRRGVIG